MSVSSLETLRIIEANLERLEQQRHHWLALREMILGEMRSQGTSQSIFTPRAGPAVTPSRPTLVVPESERIYLKASPTGATGISSVIIDIVRKNPGLLMQELTDIIVATVVPPKPVPRANHRNMVKYLIDGGKLRREDGRIYVVEPPQLQLESKKSG